jgi:hypothetical protein
MQLLARATATSMTGKDPRPEKVAAALRQISRGFALLAEAVSAGPEDLSADERYRRIMVEWGDRGLTREEASAPFRKHGFSPQAAGGRSRGDWMGDARGRSPVPHEAITRVARYAG